MSAVQEATLCLDALGRPLLTNAAKKMHPKAESRERAKWRDLTTTLARHKRIKRCDYIHVTAWGRYPDRRWLPDTDGIAPSVKGAIDGLVVAGVIPDDKAEFVPQVTYQAPQVVAGKPAALILEVRCFSDGAS